MRVFRFQGTRDVETNSYCEDVMNLWLSYRGEECEELEVTEELVDDIYNEYGDLIDARLSTEEFANLSVWEWVEKVLSFETEENAYAFQMEYKLDGVFAIPADISLEEAFQASLLPQMGLDNTYLIEAEAEVLFDLGKEFGLLVKIEEIVDIHEVPSEFRKKGEIRC